MANTKQARLCGDCIEVYKAAYDIRYESTTPKKMKCEACGKPRWCCEVQLIPRRKENDK